VADLRLAINRRTRTAEGERRESVTFVDVTAWGRQAEVICEYFTKGQPIFVEGWLRLDEWTSPDGQRRSKLCVVLEAFEFLTSRGQAGPTEEAASREPRAASSELPSSGSKPVARSSRPAPAPGPDDAEAPPSNEEPDLGAEPPMSDDVPF
jgi:single-strand DNA-binding protein